MKYINSMCHILMSNLCHLKCGGLHELDMNYHNSVHLCSWVPTDNVFVDKNLNFWVKTISISSECSCWLERYIKNKD